MTRAELIEAAGFLFGGDTRLAESLVDMVLDAAREVVLAEKLQEHLDDEQDQAYDHGVQDAYDALVRLQGPQQPVPGT